MKTRRLVLFVLFFVLSFSVQAQDDRVQVKAVSDGWSTAVQNAGFSWKLYAQLQEKNGELVNCGNIRGYDPGDVLYLDHNAKVDFKRLAYCLEVENRMFGPKARRPVVSQAAPLSHPANVSAVPASLPDPDQQHSQRMLQMRSNVEMSLAKTASSLHKTAVNTLVSAMPTEKMVATNPVAVPRKAEPRVIDPRVSESLPEVMFAFYAEGGMDKAEVKKGEVVKLCWEKIQAEQLFIYGFGEMSGKTGCVFVRTIEDAQYIAVGSATNMRDTSKTIDISIKKLHPAWVLELGLLVMAVLGGVAFYLLAQNTSHDQQYTRCRPSLSLAVRKFFAPVVCRVKGLKWRQSGKPLPGEDMTNYQVDDGNVVRMPSSEKRDPLAHTVRVLLEKKYDITLTRQSETVVDISCKDRAVLERVLKFLVQNIVSGFGLSYKSLESSQNTIRLFYHPSSSSTRRPGGRRTAS